MKAAEAKTAHRLKYPSYSYSPRKAGEKRHRLTKRRVAYNAAVEQYGAEPVIEQALTTGSVLESNATNKPHTGASPFDIPLDNPMVHHIHFDTELPHPNTMVVPVLEGLIDTHNDNCAFPAINQYPPAFDATVSKAGNEQLMHTKTLIPDIDIDFNIFGTGNFNNYSLDPLGLGLFPLVPPPQYQYNEVLRQQGLDEIAHTFFENADNQSKDKSDTADNEKSGEADGIDWESMVEFEDSRDSN